nr:immunoglobulin heavy chain junction region [Macaca mulatta]MOY21797.1 immunoglobulin heavy chain junction region [Macaca mulatta]MOY22045.1 immunoglobulin heavy chain junction region [Macaca mulatta]MOY22126.1 immunoglobulin heavy chain junction region [Macaca mulatta]MOY22236.1 immunoglobulin heavy chain junction region [Macaca mulatta]
CARGAPTELTEDPNDEVLGYFEFW